MIMVYYYHYNLNEHDFEYFNNGEKNPTLLNTGNVKDWLKYCRS